MAQELYELPEGWEWRVIPDLIDDQGLFTDGDWVESKDQDPNGDVRLIQLADVGVSEFRDRSSRFLTSDKAKKLRCSFLKPGDILFARMPDPIGRACLFPGDIKQSVTVVDVAIIRPQSENVDHKWLVYQINAPQFYSSVISLQKGATRKRISRKNLSTIKFPLPPLNEQKRIVAKLDALFTRIDTAITHLQQTLELSKALFASETNIAFDQVSSKYGTSNLSKLVKINSGIALPKIFKDWKASGSISFYKVAQMNNDDRIMKDAAITFDSDVALAHRIKLFPKGSVLIPKRGGAILTDKKRLLLEDASYDSNIMGLKADEINISDEYLFRFLLSINLGDYIDTAVIPQINNKHIAQMQIPLAPIEKQQSIVDHLDALSERTRTLEVTTQEKINDLTALKASLLDSAFKGELYRCKGTIIVRSVYGNYNK